MTSSVSQAAEFIQAIFVPEDIVLLRPVETWSDGGRKHSRTDYDGTRHERFSARANAIGSPWQFLPSKIETTLSDILQRSAEQATNVFFGACPRVGGKGQYDLAWQIRIVRALWCDIDNVSEADALQRSNDAGLPTPSIVVASGSGVHLYWLLSEPAIVDDAEMPQPVLQEWPETAATDGKKRPRKYICGADNRRIYLDQPQNRQPLSPKAQHIQDVLQGIAKSIGGDDTFDLSRLLRIPGTLNRKDERNGREPLPCQLVKCDPSTRYEFADFERFATQSTSRQQREKIERVALPVSRKITAKKADRLSELVATCDAAEVGQRSEADFSLACFAVENGIDREELWSRVQSIGKFAERGRPYFDATIAKAEGHTREKIFVNATRVAANATKSDARSTSDAEARSDQPSVEDVGLIKALADEITEGIGEGVDANSFARDAGGYLYHFRDGAYRANGERVVRQKIKQKLHRWEMTSNWSISLGEQVTEYLKVDAIELWERPPADQLNLQNGILRIADRQLLPHSPGWLSTIQLPVTYDPKATCGAIDKFIHDVFSADAIDLAYELVAWLMMPNLSIQKSVLLLGEGANGKSRFLKLLTTFLGKENTSALSLHKLEADRFAAAGLVGKLANISADLPSEHLAGTSVFKSISGGDALNVERKFGHAFEFTPFCRMIFSANHPPRSPDASHAFFRRWLAIPFDRTFADHEQISPETLDASLSTPQELSGLLNRALDALPRLVQQRGFSEPESVRRAWQDFHATTDPLSVWLERNTIEGMELQVEKGALRNAYALECERSGRPVLGARAFGLAIARLRPNVVEAQRGPRARQKWFYIGMGMRTFDSFADSAASPEPGIRHRDQRDQRDTTLSHARETNTSSGGGEYLSTHAGMGHRVDRVDAVDGCNHLDPAAWVPRSDGMYCPGCGKWLSRLPVESGMLP